MNDSGFSNNWALVAAVIVGAIAAIIILAGVVRRSASGQLRRVCVDQKKAMKKYRQVARDADKFHRRLVRLGEKAEKVKPRLLQEAQDALQDARTLQKIAHDKVLVTGNHVRRVIHEEFPPSRHQALRDRYLPDSGPDKGSFSF